MFRPLKDKKLECLNLKGEKVREWLMEYPVRYIKVVGGPVAKEAFLVGLKSGHIFEIFVDSSFPVQLIKLSNPVRYLDMSMRKQKLAAIDDNMTLFVYNLKSGDLIFQQPNATSVAWNSCYEDMLAYSSGGEVSIIVSNFPPQKHRLQVKLEKSFEKVSEIGSFHLIENDDKNRASWSASMARTSST